METSYLEFIILALASHRLTHLVVYDKILEPMRAPLVKRELEFDAGGRPVVYVTVKGKGLRRFLGELITCPWCTGIWVSAAVTLGYWWRPGVVLWPYLFLAIASVQSLIETAWLKSAGVQFRSGPKPAAGEGPAPAPGVDAPG